jgi:DnaJ-class molecular chaperone
MNFYQLLGIETNATEEQIKQAYRKRAMENHPDRNPGDKDAENRFKQIQEAYESLIKKHNTSTPHKTYHKAPQRRRETFSFYDAPPPTRDIWGKPLNAKQKEEWSRNNRDNIVEVQNKKKKNTTADFRDVFRYENEGVPDIRM